MVFFFRRSFSGSFQRVFRANGIELKVAKKDVRLPLTRTITSLGYYMFKVVSRRRFSHISASSEIAKIKRNRRFFVLPRFNVLEENNTYIQTHGKPIYQIRGVFQDSTIQCPSETHDDRLRWLLFF